MTRPALDRWTLPFRPAPRAQAPSQDHASYPSGHTTVGYGMGIVLANLMPNHAQAITGTLPRNSLKQYA